MRKGKYVSKIKIERSIKFFLSWNWIYYTDEEYVLLKILENNHKCVPFGFFITNINLIFFYHWPFLDLFWISSLLNDIKYKLCYLKRCLLTQKFYLFIVTSFVFIIAYSFSVFVENCWKLYIYTA
jgi:hypothetical protein